MAVSLVGCGGAPETQEPPPAPVTESDQTATPTPTSETSETTTQHQSTEASSEAKDSAEPVSTSAAGPTATADSGRGRPTVATTDGSSLVEPQAEQPQPTAKPSPKASRPEDMSDWKLEDYLSAKREGDARLVEAIDQLGARHVGDASVVEILAALLKQMKPEERIAAGTDSDGDAPAASPRTRRREGTGATSFSGSGGGRQGTTGVSLGPDATSGDGPMIVAAVKALSINATDRAYEVLRKIVSGKLTTDSDRVATGSAMKVLLVKDTPENEALMLRVLLEPEKMREGTVSAASSSGSEDSLIENTEQTASTAPLSADDLYQMAMQMAEPLAKESLRVKLAAHLLGNEATVRQRTDIGPMFAKQQLQNVAAQLVIYRMPILDTMSAQLKEDIEQRNSDLEEYFVELSSVSLGHVLGVLADEATAASVPAATEEPDDGGLGRIGAKGSGEEGDEGEPDGEMTRTGGGSFTGGMVDGSRSRSDSDKAVIEQLQDPKVVYPLAAKLWDSETVDVVIRRSKRVTSLGEESMTLALARTMPIDRVRGAIYVLLKDRFKDGPGQFLSEAVLGNGSGNRGYSGEMDFGGGGGAFAGGGRGKNASVGKTFLDPGLLIAVKSLPREEKRSASGSGTKKRGATTGGFGEVTTSGGSGGASSSASSPSEQWMNASQQLVEAICAQCRTVAQAPPEDDKESPKMPVKPHAKAKITARYDLILPEAVAGKFGNFQIDPIEVHYIRIEESAQFTRLAKHYRRVAKAKGRELTEKGQDGMWFDSLKTGSTPDVKRSCDVIITRQGGRSGGFEGGTTGARSRTREPEEPVVVEILTVEMKDPTGGSAD